ncbi:MAG: porin [Chromatiaceae bacterium]|nr:porin [Chromatiaceae bacterium]
MNKKLLSLAVAAAMTAPAAVLADATIYGRLDNSIDYVDVDQNAFTYGPSTKPISNVPVNSSQLLPDTIGLTVRFADGVTGTFPTATLFQAAGVAQSPFNFWQVAQDLADNDIQIIGGQALAPGEITQVRLSDGTYVDLETPVSVAASQSFTGWNLNANARSNRIGIKGSEDLGGGLKAIYQVELGVRLTNADGDIDDGDPGTISMRNTFVGLAGNWGTFLVGRHDTPFKISTGKLDLFSDTLADYNHTIGFTDVRADNAIAYISPSFSGFQFAGAIIPSGGATPLGYGAAGESPDGIADAWSVAGIYSNGPFYAGIGYEVLGKDHWSSTLDGEYVDVNGVTQTSYLGIPNYGNADDWTKWRVGLGLLDWNGFTLTGIYESNSNVAGAPADSDMDMWQFQAAYAFGNNTVKAMYGQNDTEGCVMSGVGGTYPYAATCSAAISSATGLPATDVAYLNNRDHNSWAIGFDHNFSKRTRAYMLYTATESDQVSSDWSGFSLGLVHKF